MSSPKIEIQTAQRPLMLPQEIDRTQGKTNCTMNNLDQTMKDYREKNPVNIDQVITNLQESEEREKDKK